MAADLPRRYSATTWLASRRAIGLGERPVQSSLPVRELALPCVLTVRHRGATSQWLKSLEPSRRGRSHAAVCEPGQEIRMTQHKPILSNDLLRRLSKRTGDYDRENRFFHEDF